MAFFDWFFSLRQKKSSPLDLEIKYFLASDFNKGFVDTLSSLGPITLNQIRFGEIFRDRLRNFQTIVCLNNGRIIGTASYFIEIKFLHNGGLVMHVEDVAVHKDFQGIGIGKKMMDWLEVLAKKEKCYKIILDCSKKNIKFYEKCGYKLHEYEMRKDL